MPADLTKSNNFCDKVGPGTNGIGGIRQLVVVKKVVITLLRKAAIKSKITILQNTHEN